MVIRSIPFALGLAGLLLVVGCGSDGGADRPDLQSTRTALPSHADTVATPVKAVPHYPTPRRQPGEFQALVPPKRKPQEIELVSVLVTDAPGIDGRANEHIWQAATAVTTLDYASQREITLRSVHTADRIFFLVTYPDQAASETHKSWGWDPEETIYKQMADREDVFVFKWSMTGNDAKLAFRDGEPHRADIWFWKARRTNPSGYADDKWQLLSPTAHKEARKVVSSTYGTLYLRRIGDAGRSAYEERFIYAYQGDVVPKYSPRRPQGSRADVRAKGVWHDGRWTIEFSRLLHTGHDDDLAFTRGGTYLFAVSCYEMAHGKVHPAWFQPLYKTGDAFDRLLLRLDPGDGRMAQGKVR